MTTLEENSAMIETEETRRARNAFNISVITAVLFFGILILTIIVNKSVSADLLTELTIGFGGVAAALSAVLSRRGKSETGILLVIMAFILIVASRVFVQKGLAIPTAIVHIILVSSIAIYTLSPKWVGRVILFAFINGFATVIIDQYTTNIPPSPQPQIAIIISIVLGAVYLVILARQFPSLSLRAKLLIGFLLLTTLPLMILGLQSNSTIQNLLLNQIRADIARSSLAANVDFQTFANSRTDLAQTLAHLPEIVDYMDLPANQRAGTDKELAANAKLVSLGKTDPTYILSYAVIDTSGKSVLNTNQQELHSIFRDQNFLNQIITKRKGFLSGIFLTPDPNESIFYIGSPVFSKTNQVNGVFIITCDAKIVNAILNQRLAGNPAPVTEYTFIIDDGSYLVLGHSRRLDLLYKTYLNKDSPWLTNYLTEGILDQSQLNSMVNPQPEVVTNLKNMGPTVSFRAPSIEFSGQPAEMAASRVENTNWIVVTGQPVSTIQSVTGPQLRTTVIISLVMVALAGLLALLMSGFFTRPLLQLTQVAQNIAAGDFTQTAKTNTRDEIGTLANTFNAMASQIQELVAGLERRVEQRTSELAQASRLSQKRAQELQTVAEVARYISTEKDLGKLLPLITRIVSDRFGFYHVGIFLLDETGKFAVLRAANSTGGQEMLQRQHRLEVGQTGIVGNVTASGLPRIALDTGADAVFFNNPSLPDTRSEMALPLTARGNIIGALDVQSTVQNAFTDADVSVISLLADQIAIAIDNARLIEEAQGALAESQAIFSEYLSEAWQRKTSTGVVGYHQTLSGGKVITDAQSSELVSQNTNGHKSFEVPIRVRGQVIGALNIRSISTDREWSPEDLNVVEAVVERLGLALDNARLFEETSTRASRERLVTEITTKIRGTNNPQDMIRTAVEELQQALGATRVEIVPQKSAPPPDK